MSRLFNGTTDFLEAAALTTLTGASGFSVSCWVKAAAFAANGVPVGYGDTIGAHYWCLITLSGSGDGLFERSVSSASDSTGGALATGSWNHVAAVCSSTTSGIVYVNGVAGGTDATSQGLNTQNTLDVGCLMDSGTRIVFFAGQIGEVAVWNTALAGSDITSLYGGGTNGANPTTVQSGSLAAYYQIKGTASPEPFFPSFGSVNLAVTGTTAEVGDDPPVQAPGGGGATLSISGAESTTTGENALAPFPSPLRVTN